MIAADYFHPKYHSYEDKIPGADRYMHAIASELCPQLYTLPGGQ
jgi:hypothetical protein